MPARKFTEAQAVAALLACYDEKTERPAWIPSFA